MMAQHTPSRYLPRAALFGLIAAWAAVSAPASSQAASSPSVVELFTSQGCSSCPPADALLEKLGTDPNLIVISLPVDYWDYLGWKDTFAKPAYTERQRAYSQARGDRQVYTPQAVINGRTHANGADRIDIAGAVSQTAATLDVPLGLVRKGAAVMVTVGAAGTGQPSRVGSIIAMPVIARREVAIGRGENASHKVVYTNIVRDLVPLGTWSGTATSVAIPASVLEGADSVVVLLQTGAANRPGPIIAAAQLRLN